MSFRKVTRLLCALAGGSAVVVAMAECRRQLETQQSQTESPQIWSKKTSNIWSNTPNIWTALTVLQAAQPRSWSAGQDTATSAGSGTAGTRWDNNWDKRDPLTLRNGKKARRHRGTEDNSTGEELDSELEKNKPKATRHIILIRHSQYNLDGTVDKERVLTPLGREQAELTGQRLASLGLKYDVLVHSSMTRATETASIISKHLPDVETVSCDLLREGSPIPPTPPISWRPDFVYHEDGARIEAAFRRYMHRADADQTEDSYDIIVCHANVIRYFVCRALQFPPEGWLRLSLNNGSITWFSIRPSGRVGLRMMGDSGFMPPDKLTRT